MQQLPVTPVHVLGASAVAGLVVSHPRLESLAFLQAPAGIRPQPRQPCIPCAAFLQDFQGRQNALCKQTNLCLDEEKDRDFLNFISTLCSWSSLIPSHPLCFQSSCNSDSCASSLPTCESYQVNIQLKLRATVDYTWADLHHSNETQINSSWNDITDAVFLLCKRLAYKSVIW